MCRLFLSAIWPIWNERNKRCFEVVSLNDSPLVDRVKYLVAVWSSVFPHVQSFPLTMILHNWKEVAFSYPMASIPDGVSPPLGNSKLSFDGSSSGNQGWGGLGWEA
eukprot:TRINITY_DN5094_c0_g2_i1.p1 TRINITY_DN5094_c0_g2~~TRINITY_DN5094_c0_g2_i1.p1  ORF type:complete len:106 (-),score=21.56 TRINITY_DN5094_c0_g2_i1:692-1009(-)